jgi:hypothetical protein
VKDELLAQGVWESLESIIGRHLHVENVADSDVDAKLATFASLKLHRADASVIFLAERLKPSAVLTDDLNLLFFLLFLLIKLFFLKEKFAYEKLWNL